MNTKIDRRDAGGRILLSVQEAAQALGISERLLFTLTRSGVIPCVRVGDGRGRRKLYRPETLEHFARSREAAAAAGGGVD
jgi:excisionase family DNA binding protein